MAGKLPQKTLFFYQILTLSEGGTKVLEMMQEIVSESNTQILEDIVSTQFCGILGYQNTYYRLKKYVKP